MSDQSDLEDLLDRVLAELRDDGFEPDVMMAGPEFISQAAELLKKCSLHVYRIEELGYDAVIADSKYLGHVKRASRRISVEPLMVEGQMWKELENLRV